MFSLVAQDEKAEVIQDGMTKSQNYRKRRKMMENLAKEAQWERRRVKRQNGETVTLGNAVPVTKTRLLAVLAQELENPVVLLVPGIGDSWYEAIYVHPELDSVAKEMDQIVQKITRDDIYRFVLSFRQGVRYGVGQMKDFCWKLNNISQYTPKIMEYAEWFRREQWAEELFSPGLTMSFIHDLSGGELSDMYLMVNWASLRKASLIELLQMVAHESWHGVQAVRAAEVDQVENPMSLFHPDPKRADRRLLYRVNEFLTANAVIDGDQMYMQQMLEQEAMLFSDKMFQRVQKIVNEYQDVILWRSLNAQVWL